MQPLLTAVVSGRQGGDRGARGSGKVLGAFQALAGVDLTAQARRLLALLGPNEAGKTTLVRMLATLLRADDDARARARVRVHLDLRPDGIVRRLIAS
jgi:ABC-type multidrug transport system ATPase subunit